MEVNSFFLADARVWIERLLASGKSISAPFGMADNGVYSELEEKLLRLALDAAAQPGEQHNAAVALVQSLRKRGVRPEYLILGSELAANKRRSPREAPTGSEIENPGAILMPWGKYEGIPIRLISPKYLRFCLWKCGNADPGLLAAIRAYLRILRDL